MSIDPENMLEEALRGDLPTPDAEARVRRRLVAAGVAVGNGVATSTAAAAGSAATAAKMAGLSWGLKLGLAALVAIPTVGLLLDGRAERTQAAQAPVVAPAQPAEVKVQLAVEAPKAPGIAAEEAEQAAPAPERAPSRNAKAVVIDPPSPSDVAAKTSHPSQADFAASEPPARAPQVGSTLAEETRLLDGAFAQLAAGNLSRAAALIQEHETRFPAGLLQKERERAKTRLSELSRGE